MSRHRLIFAVSGASGMPLARALLSHFHLLANLELHLIVSDHAREVLKYEQPMEGDVPSFSSYAFVDYPAHDFSAPPASGSWPCTGMVVCPCSMATLAAIANGFGQNLIHRAADVMLKERRPLVLVPRETPLNRIHLVNLLAAHDAGATIMPFMPAYYLKKTDQSSQLQQFAGRILDQFRIPHAFCQRWQETS